MESSYGRQFNPRSEVQCGDVATPCFTVVKEAEFLCMRKNAEWTKAEQLEYLWLTIVWQT